MWSVLLLVLFNLVSLAKSDDLPFVAGDTICDVCSCAIPEEPGHYFTLNCNTRGLSNVLSNWPTEFEEENETKGKYTSLWSKTKICKY